jgi:photosystem II stability/assembly factor-like uncharacterized protein
MIFVGLYSCTEKSITMPEDINKIEYSIIDDYKNYVLNGIYFMDEMNGLIKCMGGQRLLKTSDGGNSWEQIYLNSESGSMDLSFISSHEGWLINSQKGGEISLLNSMDGGNSWNKIYSFDHNFLTPSLLSIDFVNDSVGWVSMYNDNYQMFRIFKTVNGGHEWILQRSDREESYLIHNNFINENTGWVCTNNDIYITKDGGQSWTAQGRNIPRLLDAPQSSFGKIHFIDEYTGFILRYGYLLFRTDDGGYTWIMIYKNNSIFPDSSLNFQTQYCYDFYNKNLGAISRDSLFITQDGGRSWKLIYGKQSGDDKIISNLCFANKNTLFAVDKNMNILKFIIY